MSKDSLDNVIGSLHMLQNEIRALGVQPRRLVMDLISPHKNPDRSKQTVLIMPGYVEPPFATRGLANFLRENEYRTYRWGHTFW